MYSNRFLQSAKDLSNFQTLPISSSRQRSEEHQVYFLPEYLQTCLTLESMSFQPWN